MLKHLLHRTALSAERLLDRLRPDQDHTGMTLTIDPHIGYATPENVILRGRVLERLPGSEVQEGQRVGRNIWQMVSLFLTKETAGVTVHHGEYSAVSDEEGYFQLLLPPGLAPGWHALDVHIGEQEKPIPCPVLVPQEDARFMVISDIDDTVLHTSAYSLARNLWTTFSGNALTRRIYQGSSDLLRHLSQDGRNPVYYVSSSPWNIHGFLAQVFRRTELIRGPMFLRDMGLSETQFITAGHGSHKGHSIDLILAANPDLPAILMGDTGQKDAAIYAEAVRRHPGRILAVALRVPADGLSAADRTDLAALKATGVTVFSGPELREARAVLDPVLPTGQSNAREVKQPG